MQENSRKKYEKVRKVKKSDAKSKRCECKSDASAGELGDETRMRRTGEVRNSRFKPHSFL